VRAGFPPSNMPQHFVVTGSWGGRASLSPTRSGTLLLPVPPPTLPARSHVRQIHFLLGLTWINLDFPRRRSAELGLTRINLLGHPIDGRDSPRKDASTGPVSENFSVLIQVIRRQNGLTDFFPFGSQPLVALIYLDFVPYRGRLGCESRHRLGASPFPFAAWGMMQTP